MCGNVSAPPPRLDNLSAIEGSVCMATPSSGLRPLSHTIGEGNRAATLVYRPSPLMGEGARRADEGGAAYMWLDLIGRRRPRCHSREGGNPEPQARRGGF